MRERPAGDAEGVREGQRIGIARAGERAECGLVHQGANGEMREQKAPRFLADQLGGFAAEHAVGALQMGLELVERGLDV